MELQSLHNSSVGACTSLQHERDTLSTNSAAHSHMECVVRQLFHVITFSSHSWAHQIWALQLTVPLLLQV